MLDNYKYFFKSDLSFELAIFFLTQANADKMSLILHIESTIKNILISLLNQEVLGFIWDIFNP